MKVLMSGFTALQINTEKRTIQKIDVPASIAKALREQKERGPVVTGANGDLK
jgi:hypothetical protein